MNWQTRFSDAETLFDQGYYAQAVNTCGQALELLLRDLYHRVINSLPPAEAQKVLETLETIGKGKRVDELTLGQLDGLFRQAKLYARVGRVLGQPVRGLENLRTYIDLRNQATHRDAQIDRASAEAFLSHTRWLVQQLEAIERPARPETRDLPAWLDVVRPHRDIREGRFDPEVFAVKLDDVLAGRGPLEYRDPELFFRYTYPTAGLRRLVDTVVRCLNGGGGARVIRLETPFGGGKTHALLTLYHLFQHRAQVLGLDSTAQVLGDIAPEEVPEARVAVFVGTAPDPLKGRTPWGELAEQLGVYDLVREHDERRVSPGKSVLRRVLEASAPALLLVDELAHYLVKATEVPGEGETMRRQTLAFLQELTEVVTSIPRVSLVLTLPSSVLEFHDEEVAEEILARLRHITGRVEAIYTPVEGVEIYEVIRRRLFEEPEDPLRYRRAVERVAEAYGEMYRSLGEDVPSMAREPGYRARIRRAYPFHPELIDILLERWSTFKTFQRTRGVLRLLAQVIYDRYERGDTAPLLQPAHLNLRNRNIREEFLNHISRQFDGVVAADIVDTNARAEQLDREMEPEYRRYHVATALATAIFFYSFSAGDSLEGVGVPRLRLAFLQPGIPPAIFGDVLARLQDELWYLHREENRYYFSLQPNLNRVLLDYMDEVSEEDLFGEVRRQVKHIGGRDLAVYPFPADRDDLPDDRKIKLAVLSPEYLWGYAEAEEKVRELFERHGEAPRVYKNTLLVLAMDEGSWVNLAQTLRRWLALRAISENSELMARFSEADQKDVKRRLRELDVEFGLLSAYRTLIRVTADGLQVQDLGQAAVGEKTLAERVRTFLESQELLLRRLSPGYVRDRLLGGRDEIAYRVVADTFFTVPGNLLLESESVLRQAVVEGVRQGFFGVRIGETIYDQEGFPPERLEEEAYIIRRELAEEAKKGEEKAPERRVSPPVTPVRDREGLPEVDVAPPEKGTTVRIITRIPWDKLAEFVSGVLLPLRNAGAEVDLRVDLTAQSREPLGPNVLDLKVRETLQQIGAEVETFENW